jgi:hypothetical protein
MTLNERRAPLAVELAAAAALDLSALRRDVARAGGAVPPVRGDGRHVNAPANGSRPAPRCVGCGSTGTTTRTDETVVALSLVFVAAGLPGGGHHYCRACLGKRDAFLATRTPRSDG